MDDTTGVGLTTAQAKAQLLAVGYAPPSTPHALLSDGTSLLRRYPLASLALATLAGALIMRFPSLRRAAVQAAVGMIASRGLPSGPHH